MTINQISDIYINEKKFLFFVFILSFFIRALLFECFTQKNNCDLVFDAAQYQEIAEQINTGHGISTANGEPNFYRLPGYPLYLACCYNFFGNNIKNALRMQIFLASFIPILIYFLALALLPMQLVLAQSAALFSAFYVGFCIHASTALTESLFLLFFLIFLILFLPKISFFFFKNQQIPKISQAYFWAGLFLGIASLFRAIGHYSIILIFFLLLISSLKWHEKIKAFVLTFLGWLIIVGGWLLRNYLLTGFLFFHTLPGIHFLQYSAVFNVMGYMNLGDENYFKTKKQVYQEWQNLIKIKQETLNRALNEYEQNEIAHNLAIHYLVEKPWLTIKHACIHMARTCFTLHSSWILSVPKGTIYKQGTSLWFKIKLYLFPNVEHPGLLFFIYLDLILSLIIGLGFLFFLLSCLFNTQNVYLLCKVLPFISLFIFITLAYGCARLRMPIEPLLIILALAGWGNLIKKTQPEAL